MGWFTRKKREDQEKGTYAFQRTWQGLVRVKVNDRELPREKLEKDVIAWVKESVEQKEKNGWEIDGLTIYGGALETTPSSVLFYVPFSLTVKERRKQHG